VSNTEASADVFAASLVPRLAGEDVRRTTTGNPPASLPDCVRPGADVGG
jgi:hypothetical protein